jgi:WD40 repeat protein
VPFLFHHIFSSFLCESKMTPLYVGSQLFSGSEDGTIRVWNLESKKCVAVLKEHFSTVTSLILSEDGHTLLSAGRDKVC